MRLLRKEIQDQFTQENFKRIEDDFNDQAFYKGNFKFYETTFGLSTSTFPLTTTFVHSLKFTPKDVILLNFTGGTISFNFADFNATTISVTVSAVVTARFFLGRYGEGL